MAAFCEHPNYISRRFIMINIDSGSHSQPGYITEPYTTSNIQACIPTIYHHADHVTLYRRLKPSDTV